MTRVLPGDALDRLRACGHEVVVHPGALPPTPDELRALVSHADGLLCTLADRVDEPLLAAAADLRAIAVYAVGTDNIDFEATGRRAIAVGNTPDVLTDATADLAMALLLAAARRLPAAERNVRDGHWATWEPGGFLGLELRGARLVIVGGGRIGRATGERAEAFGMDVTFVGRGDDLHRALGAADVVSLHAPLTPGTRGLIGRDALAALPRGAILVNTARGELVDQLALAEALTSGHLAAAALDVTTPEPLPADDPLLDAPNLLVVPHIGSATTKARAAMAEQAVANLLAGLGGEPMPWPAEPSA
ncbi:MAG: NAD(P)-dependent oxidoreductase [Solirubrobacteraceae bacterium]|nr:NAD(P)-dependent oxidoreductase [Solirubrobacteraceae bacterium]